MNDKENIEVLIDNEIEKIVKYMEVNDENFKFSTRLRQHTKNTAFIAIELAKIYSADTEKVLIAAVYHDLFKDYSIEQLNEFVVKYYVGDKYLNAKNIAHSKVSAEFLTKNWNELFCNRQMSNEIIDGISFHTTGRKGMSLVEKIVFLADGIEPLRNYDGVDRIRDIAKYDLDMACLIYGKQTVKHLLEKGVNEKEIDRDTFDMIQELGTI